ncbi:MAG TPA: molybdate ABC transporter substrate-binding protein [Methylomirabilota bacterium]|nr:molybdate ABC transporter substrate-binding protein [Methylomirabilota bacterium]
MSRAGWRAWAAVLGALLAASVGGPGLVALARSQELTVSAAISTREAVEALGRELAAARPGLVLRFNFGSSGELQKQIEAGAPVDVFVSAAAGPMDQLAQKGLIVAASRRVFARNALTIVKPADSRLDLARPADLLDPRVSRIVIGNPRTVPAGQYAEESLRALGLWDRLRSKLVLAENVRQALDYVVRGEVDAGFVYTTDAATRRGGVREAFRPGEDTYRPVIYPVATVAGTRHPVLAAAFIDALAGLHGQSVLRRLGFLPPPDEAR